MEQPPGRALDWLKPPLKFWALRLLHRQAEPEALMQGWAGGCDQGTLGVRLLRDCGPQQSSSKAPFRKILGWTGTPVPGEEQAAQKERGGGVGGPHTLRTASASEHSACQDTVQSGSKFSAAVLGEHGQGASEARSSQQAQADSRQPPRPLRAPLPLP